MNVAFEPWIPVVNTSGKRELASLCSVLTEGDQYADLAVRPHERVSLMRLFLCVAHAALNGPKNYDEWVAVPKRLPEAAKTYLTERKDSFELFDEKKPWLQVAGLTPARNTDANSLTPISKLDFSLASSLFEHKGGQHEFDYPRLILGLLTIQNFSTCGLLSQPLWNKKQTPKSAKDAPCISSSMYHVFLVGKNMADTIHINICDFDELAMLIKKARPEGDWIGRPVWERMPNNVSDMASTETFLGRLTPLSRAVRLFPKGSKMLYGEALRYAVYPDFPQEFNTSVIAKRIKRKVERYLVGAKLNVRPWRQLDALLQYDLSGKTPSHAINLNHLKDEPIDVWVGALIRKPGKQDILDSVESRFPISRSFRTEIGCAAYANEIKSAESLSVRLGWAVEEYRKEIDGYWERRVESSKNKWELKAKLHSLTTIHYWTAVEKNLPLLMAHITAVDSADSEPTLKAWRNMLFQSSLEAYSVACGQGTPRQIRAYAKGLEILAKSKDEPETDNAEDKEDEE